MTKLNKNAIDINAGFEMGSSQPIDARFIMTKQQMHDISDDVMPPLYPTWCSEDGLQYIYTKTNQIDKTTGKFRAVKSGILSGSLTSSSTDDDYTNLMAEEIINIEITGINTSAEWSKKVNPGNKTIDENNHLSILKIGESLTYSYCDDTELTEMWCGLTTKKANKVYPQLLVNTMPVINADIIRHNALVIYNGSDESVYKRGYAYKIGTSTNSGSFYKVKNANESVIYATANTLINNLPIYVGVEIDGKTAYLPTTLVEDEITIGTFYPEEHIGESDWAFIQTDVDTSEITELTGPSWVQAYNDTGFIQHFPVLPNPQTKLGEIVQYTGATNADGLNYVEGHFYKAVSNGKTPATYSWVDMSPDNFQFGSMPNAADLQGKIVQYIGETTFDQGTKEPIYIKGHFYQSTENASQSPSTWEWTQLDTESDVYDTIEKRPLILHRGKTFFNDTVTLGAGDSTTSTISDKTLVADNIYKISVDGVEKPYTAVLDAMDNSVKIDASDIGITITTADSSTDSTMTLTNAKFSVNPVIVVKENNSVEVNPDYADFFNGVTDGASMQEDIVANVEVGGVAVGDVVKQGKNLTEVIRQLLVKYFAPIFVTPDSGSDSDKALLNKKGSTITSPIEVYAKSKKTSLDIVKTSIELEGIELITDTTHPAGVEVTAIYGTNITTDTTFVAKADDGKSITEKQIKFEFILPYIYGFSSTNVLEDINWTDPNLVEDLKKKQPQAKYTYTASAQYLVFAYDKTYGELTSIKDPSNFENINAWVKGEAEIAGEDGVNQTYYVYITADKITCSQFAYIFKI